MKRRIGSVIFGSILLSIGLVFFWTGIPHTYSLICEKTTDNQINCQKQEKILWWIQIKTISLKQLQSVSLGQGENAYDSIVYFVYIKGKINHLMFGNSLDLEEVKTDIFKAKQFLKNEKNLSLTLQRYEVDWTFVILGLPIGTLGFWSMIYRYN